MIFTLNKDSNLKGYGFEYIARIILRRNNKNNFCFLLNRFDSIDEILIKYNISTPNKFKEFISHLRIEWNRCDIIEFELNNNKERIINNITIYDVKTKNHYIEKNYFEMCASNHKFFKNCKKFNIEAQIISIILFEDWKFSYNIIPFEKVQVRNYSNFKPKIKTIQNQEFINN